MKGLKLDVVALRDYLMVVKRQLVTQVSPRSEIRGKMNVPKPKSFGGTQSLIDLGNFVRDMENYFEVAKVLDFEEVIIATMYLVNDAKL